MQVKVESEWDNCECCYRLPFKLTNCFFHKLYSLHSPANPGSMMKASTPSSYRAFATLFLLSWNSIAGISSTKGWSRGDLFNTLMEQDRKVALLEWWDVCCSCWSDSVNLYLQLLRVETRMKKNRSSITRGRSCCPGFVESLQPSRSSSLSCLASRTRSDLNLFDFPKNIDNWLSGCVVKKEAQLAMSDSKLPSSHQTAFYVKYSFGRSEAIFDCEYCCKLFQR